MIEVKNINDCYKHYKGLCTERQFKPVNSKIYKDIIYAFTKFLVGKLLDGFELQLSGGYSLGTLAIIGRKTKLKLDDLGRPKSLPPNWKATKALWARDAEAKANKKVVFHLNEHSDGVRYRVTWSKARAILTNKIFYTFTMSRKNKRNISKGIREGKEYITTIY